jgi:hypothetical protein
MSYLDEVPLRLIFVTSLAAILLASEIGRWLGVRARGRGEEPVTTIEGAMFALLAQSARPDCVRADCHLRTKQNCSSCCGSTLSGE